MYCFTINCLITNVLRHDVSFFVKGFKQLHPTMKAMLWEDHENKIKLVWNKIPMVNWLRTPSNNLARSYRGHTFNLMLWNWTSRTDSEQNSNVEHKGKFYTAMSPILVGPINSGMTFPRQQCNPRHGIIKYIKAFEQLVLCLVLQNR